MTRNLFPAGTPERQARWILAFHLVMSLAPVVFGVVWGIREVRTLTVPEIGTPERFRYTVALRPSAYRPYFDVEGDALRHARRARTRVFEDGRRLGPPHRPHDYIREDGGGQFSHWGSTLYFSGSDNSDPRVNGRIYTVVTAATLPLEILWVWGLFVLAGAFRAIFRPRSRSVWTLPGAWKAACAVLLVGFTLGAGAYSIDPASFGSIRVGLALWAVSLLASAVLAWRSGGELVRLGPAFSRDVRVRGDKLLVRLNRPFARSGRGGWILRVASLSIPFLVFAVLLRVPLRAEILIGSYYFVTPIALPAGIALFLCHMRRDWLGIVATLTMTLALFALPLAALWQHFATHINAVGGLLPFSDASGYYYDARRLLQGHTLGWSARRPLFAALLATLLAITGQNLQTTICALVALNAVAAFLLARELRASHGPAAATVATVVLFLFYRSDGGEGTVLTENLGFAMGCVAFAVLWRGSRSGSIRSVCIGLGLLTVALMARAGAFFVLPALGLAGVWAFRSNRGWLRFAVDGLAAGVIAAGLTMAIGRVLSDPAGEQTTFSNFSYSLYGLVVGGKGWSQVLRDHPQATEGAEIYSLAWQAFRAHPMGLVEGSLKMWGEYFRLPGLFHAFAFVHDGSYERFFQVVCYGLSAVGIGLSIRHYRQPSYMLLLAAVVGHLGSIPFVPPIDAGLRVYAATIPILAILTGLGAAQVVGWGRRLRSVVRPGTGALEATTGFPRTAPGAELFGAALATVVFLGPLCVLIPAIRRFCTRGHVRRAPARQCTRHGRFVLAYRWTCSGRGRDERCGPGDSPA